MASIAFCLGLFFFYILVLFANPTFIPYRVHMPECSGLVEAEGYCASPVYPPQHGTHRGDTLSSRDGHVSNQVIWLPIWYFSTGVPRKDCLFFLDCYLSVGCQVACFLAEGELLRRMQHIEGAQPGTVPCHHSRNLVPTKVGAFHSWATHLHGADMLARLLCDDFSM